MQPEAMFEILVISSYHNTNSYTDIASASFLREPRLQWKSQTLKLLVVISKLQHVVEKGYVLGSLLTAGSGSGVAQFGGGANTLHVRTTFALKTGIPPSAGSSELLSCSSSGQLDRSPLA